VERKLRETLEHGKFTNVPHGISLRMSAIRNRGNRTTELRLRGALIQAGIRGWSVHPQDLPGNPDFLFRRSYLAIFVDGCFWHGCPKCSHGITKNSSYWAAKIARNRERDKSKERELRELGFRVLRIWEHELTKSPSASAKRIQSKLR
jgi:DNA mismatch endonuclease (patch repair protein)